MDLHRRGAPRTSRRRLIGPQCPTRSTSHVRSTLPPMLVLKQCHPAPPARPRPRKLAIPMARVAPRRPHRRVPPMPRVERPSAGGGPAADAVGGDRAPTRARRPTVGATTARMPPRPTKTPRSRHPKRHGASRGSAILGRHLPWNPTRQLLHHPARRPGRPVATPKIRSAGDQQAGRRQRTPIVVGGVPAVGEGQKVVVLARFRTAEVRRRVGGAAPPARRLRQARGDQPGVVLAEAPPSFPCTAPPISPLWSSATMS